MFLKKMKIFGKFLEKMSSFWQFFDSQNGNFTEGQLCITEIHKMRLTYSLTPDSHSNSPHQQYPQLIKLTDPMTPDWP